MIGFIIGFILFAVIVGCGIFAGRNFYLCNEEKDEYHPNKDKINFLTGKAVVATVVTVIFLIAFLIIPFSIHTIDSGEVAVIKNLGQVEEAERTAGTYYDFWVTKTYVKYDTTVHTDVTLQNGKNKGQPIPESIEIKGVFLSTKNPVVRLGLVIK